MSNGVSFDRHRRWLVRLPTTRLVACCRVFCAYCCAFPDMVLPAASLLASGLFLDSHRVGDAVLGCCRSVDRSGQSYRLNRMSVQHGGAARIGSFKSVMGQTGKKLVSVPQAWGKIVRVWDWLTAYRQNVLLNSSLVVRWRLVFFCSSNSPISWQIFKYRLSPPTHVAPNLKIWHYTDYAFLSARSNCRFDVSSCVWTFFARGGNIRPSFSHTVQHTRCFGRWRIRLARFVPFNAYNISSQNGVMCGNATLFFGNDFRIRMRQPVFETKPGWCLMRLWRHIRWGCN